MIFNRDVFVALLVGTAHMSAAKTVSSAREALQSKADFFGATARFFPSSSSISPSKKRGLQTIGFGGDQTTTETTETTSTVDEVNFRATYLARFQHLVDSVCEAPNPTIAVFCQGEISPLSLSDSSIECSTLTNQNGWKGLVCSNTCGASTDRAACDEVFLESENAGGARFGEIIFQCEGSDIADVDAYMHYVGGDEGSCVAQATTSESAFSRNFHVAQLGVQCSEDDSDTFRFDDIFFECDFFSSSANVEGVYTCLSGTNCAGEECTTTFEDLFVEADRENFHECVEAVGGATVPAKPSKIEVEPVATGDYTAVFQANWQLLVDVDTCRGEFAPKRISCTNGDIKFEESMADDINCTMISDSEMECTDGSPSFVNEFSGVRFSCQSKDEIPQAIVEYMSGDAFCDGTADNSVVHLLQLGVECSDSDGDFTVYNDYILECGDGNIHNLVEGRYTCAAAAVFSSSNREETPTGVAQIGTDFRWGAGSFDTCYTRTGGTSSTQSSGTTVGGDSTPAPLPAPTSPTSDNVPTSPPEAVVEAVPGTTFTVEYKARFKRVVDDGCEAPSKDTIFIICPKGKLEVLDTHDSVVCLPVAETTDGNGELVLCETSCNGDACNDVYVDRESFWVFTTWVLNEDLYAEVSYSCSAEDDVNGVDSLYFLLGSEDSGEEGSCTGTGTGDGQNLLFGELNVMCDTPEGRVSVNDDAYTECDYGSSWDVNGAYTCWEGRFCQDTACAVTFDDMFVYADHHRFRECIMTDNDSGVPTPEVEVDESEVAPGLYSAQFRVGSGYWYDDENCSGSKTGIKIECLDGGTINLIEGSADKSCSVTSQSTVECIETETSVINEHVDVAVYECTSQNGVPQTTVEYYSADLECESTSAERGRRWINMGVLCSESTGGESYVTRDYFFECGKDNKSGEVTEELRFACSGEANIPSNSGGSIFTIPKVDMMTDYRWEFFSLDTCYTFKPSTKSLSIHDSAKAIVDETKKAGGGQRSLLSSVASMSSANSSNVLVLPVMVLFLAGVVLA